MNCSQCGAQWNVPGQAKQPTTCPFCGEALAAAPGERPQTTREVLEYIIEHFGIEKFRDPKATVGIFMDLAPQLDAQIRMIRYFADADTLKDLAQIHQQPAQQQLVSYRKVVRKMVDNWLLREDLVETFCMAFMEATHVQLPSQANEPVEAPGVKAPEQTPERLPKPENKSAAKTPEKAASVAQAQSPAAIYSPIHSYESYRQVLMEYYLLLYPGYKKRRLSQQQIWYFIYAHDLQRRFAIRFHEVEKDLQEIYTKLNVNEPPVQDPDPGQVRRPIRNYEDYLSELRHLYYENNMNRLADAQIIEFLRQHELDRRFGIRLQEVRQDLKTMHLT